MRLLYTIGLVAALGLANAAAPQALPPCAEVLGGPAEPVKPNAGHPQAEAEVIALVNRVRVRGCTCPTGAFQPAVALRPSAELRAIAFAHSADMASNDFFAQESPTTGSLRDRVDGSEYAWRAIGENLAAGPRTSLEVMRGWLESPDHCPNVMAERYREIGVALVNDPDDTARVRVGDGELSGPFGSYWTQVFATPRYGP